MTPPDFLTPSPTLAVMDGAAHVWLAGLEVSTERLRRLRSVLTVEEKARADRFLQPQHRVDRAASRGILRELLGAALGVAPGVVEFSFNAHGKPSLAGALAESGLRFNLSHSHGFALIALARGHELGVDIERIRPDFATARIADRYFSSAESAVLRALPSDKQAQGFFECWTRKEAYVKARGDGLTRSLASFEVSFGPGAAPAILHADDEPDAAGRWGVHDVPAPEGFVGALVIERPGCAVNLWRVE